jgi:anti-anti-sigma regulatory factor
MTELSIPDGVEVMEITGPLFFGAGEELRKAFRIEKEFAPRIRILRLRNVPAIDASGLMIRRDMVQEAQGLNVQLFFAAVQPNVMEAMKQIGLTKMLGESNIFPNVVVALNRAQAILGQQMVPLTERLRIGGEPMVIQARDIYDAVQQVGDSLTFPVEIKKRITQALLERETLMPTTLGYGFCFPHPREMNVLPP